ncbi:MAG: efflux RND transporter periplasmic adaptor subunit [Rhodoferax sp.]|nr:efflux RND transporter periplasmic adaptor subunit [Rhodoferax sp.]MCP5261215.1 efflux RND transporter periplasmic adaptor subunit [Rhodoferax sp.]
MSSTFKRNTLVIAALALCAAAAVALWARNSSADEAPAAAPEPAATAKPALTVTAVRPQLGRLPMQLRANGSIAAWQEASVGTEANGLRLSELRAGIGDVVRAGQVLATFDAASVQADVALARAQLQEAQANALEAAGNAERARTLKDSGALSTQQINQYLTLEQTAQARVAAAKAALDVQQLRLKHAQVLAPDRGVITSRSATIGAVVPAGTELFRMIRQGRLEWRAEVTSNELGRIKPGTPVLVTVASGAEVRGKVRTIGPTVDNQTRTALVYVDLPSTKDLSGPAKPGMFASGSFELGDSSALLVPQTTLVMRDGFSYVYKLGDDNRVSRIKVQTGRQAGDQVEITSAFDADARLVATGAGFLNEGDLVRVVDAAGNAAAAPVTSASR